VLGLLLGTSNPAKEEEREVLNLNVIYNYPAKSGLTFCRTLQPIFRPILF